MPAPRATARPQLVPSAAWAASGYTGPCPVRDVLDRVGDTWSVLVILHLGLKPKRFSELLRDIGSISQRMLTVSLRGLERDGMVLRRVFDTQPPAVEYSLSPLGVSLLEPIRALADWATAHEADVQTARAAYDARQSAAPVPGVTLHRLK